MWVWTQCVQKGVEDDFELWASFSTAHGPFHAHLECNFFEFLAVLVLAVVYRMDQLMHQSVQHVKCLPQRRRDEDLVDTVVATTSAPALAYMTAQRPGAGKTHGNFAERDGVPFGAEKRRHSLYGSLKPGLPKGVAICGGGRSGHDGKFLK